MSRRDTIVDALLGTLLLLVFLARLAALALVVWCGCMGLDWMVRLVFPNWTLTTESLLFGIWTSIAVWSAIGHARRGRWRNAFLCFLGALVTCFAWFTPIHSSIGGSGNAWLFWIPVMAVVTVGDDASLGRIKFSLAAAIGGVAVAVNCGLLGNGKLSQTVANYLLATVFVWWIVDLRKGLKTESLDPPLALPPAGA